jgi:hypothetical protein
MRMFYVDIPVYPDPSGDFWKCVMVTRTRRKAEAFLEATFGLTSKESVPFIRVGEMDEDFFKELRSQKIKESQQ